MFLTIRSFEDVERYLDVIQKSAACVQSWLAENTDSPISLLRRMKFDPIGRHPIENRKLNLIEQINQTFTFAVALEATRKLLQLHPNEGFRLAPGARASIPLDIMSETEDLAGAEVFAAVDPRNNGKLKGDLLKLENRPERHRYIFFMSPRYPGTTRLEEFDKFGVQVWSVDF